jgi:capsid protein
LQDFSGVVVDSVGRPKRYRIYNRQKTSTTMVQAMEVEAANFLHLFDPTRLDSYRGFSAFDAAINDIKDAAELLGLEKIALKYLCSKSGIVTNATGEAPGDVLLDVDHADYNADADRLKKVEPGAIEDQQEGQGFVPLDSYRPSSTFAGFIETLMRRTGLSLNLPFGFIYTWAGQGTAVRMEAAQATREFEQTQLILEERFLDPIVLRVIARGIQLGDLPAVPDFDRGEWRYPAKITADVGRESKALIEEYMAGLTSKTQINADRGEDGEMVREFRRAEALELVEDAKAIVASSAGEIDLKLALFMLEKRAPNAPMEPVEPADTEDDKKPAKVEANSIPIAPPQIIQVHGFQAPPPPVAPPQEDVTGSIEFIRASSGELEGARTKTRHVKFIRNQDGCRRRRNHRDLRRHGLRIYRLGCQV